VLAASGREAHVVRCLDAGPVSTDSRDDRSPRLLEYAGSPEEDEKADDEAPDAENNAPDDEAAAEGANKVVDKAKSVEGPGGQKGGGEEGVAAHEDESIDKGPTEAAIQIHEGAEGSRGVPHGAIFAQPDQNEKEKQEPPGDDGAEGNDGVLAKAGRAALVPEGTERVQGDGRGRRPGTGHRGVHPDGLGGLCFTIATSNWKIHQKGMAMAMALALRLISIPPKPPW